MDLVQIAINVANAYGLQDSYDMLGDWRSSPKPEDITGDEEEVDERGNPINI